MMRPLTTRQKHFAIEYKRVRNAHLAALLAGYSEGFARSDVSYLARDPRIQAEVFPHLSDPEYIEDIRHSNILIMVNLRTFALQKFEEAKRLNNQDLIDKEYYRLQDTTVRLGKMLGQGLAHEIKQTTRITNTVHQNNTTIEVSNISELIKKSEQIISQIKSRKIDVIINKETAGLNGASH